MTTASPRMNGTLRIIVALIVGLLAYSHADAQPTLGAVSDAERQVLMEFFAATGGERWTKRDGWGTSAPVCDWYGVWCDVVGADLSRPFVAGLNLGFNNLDGQIPVSLANLGLNTLNVGGNRLRGTLPERFLQRWDKHEFELRADGNAFSDVVVRASVKYSASGALCAEHDDLHFRLDLDAIKQRAVFQSTRCADVTSRRTYCLVREGTPGSFVRLSRELKALRFASFEPEYEYPFSAATHGVYVTTTAAWGDGTESSVQTYNRQGPREVWVAQQLFLGLLAETYWERETRKAKCDFEK
jgi:hypothetical protein